ncbi:MAG: hypothetical protein WBA74_23690, partial [Cyclobacteriaceae bacterium]
MNTFCRPRKILLVLLMLFVASSAFSLGGLESYNYDECNNEITFRFVYAVQHNANSCVATDFHENIMVGDMDLIVNGSETIRILETRNGKLNGWKQFKSYGLSDRWNSFDEKFNWVDLSYGEVKSSKAECFFGDGTRRTFYANVKIKIPAQYSGEGQSVRVEFKGHSDKWKGGACCRNKSTHNFDDETSRETMPRLNAPGSLLAERTCDGVKLTWAKTSFNCENSASFVIKRNGQEIGTVPFTGNLEFFDAVNYRLDTGNDPNPHNYSVQMRFNSSIADLSNAATVSENPLRKFDRSDYFVSTGKSVLDECNQRLRIDWEISEDVNVDRFVVERSISSDFPDDQTEYFEVANQHILTYTDNNVPLDRTYFYRVRAFDDCGSNSGAGVTNPETMVLNHTFDGPPSNPSITEVVSNNTGEEFATIHWSHNGLKTERFRILKDGQEIVGDLGPDVRSYVDNNLTNCGTYGYQVEAIGKCFPNQPGRSQIVNQIISFNKNLSSFAFFKVSKNFFNDRINLEWQLDQVAIDNEVKIIAVYRKREGSSDTPAEVARFEASKTDWSDVSAEAGVVYRYGIMAIACDSYQPSASEINEMVTEIGIRSEYGLINGKIAYEGGNAVE